MNGMRSWLSPQSLDRLNVLFQLCVNETNPKIGRAALATLMLVIEEVIDSEDVPGVFSDSLYLTSNIRHNDNIEVEICKILVSEPGRIFSTAELSYILKCSVRSIRVFVCRIRKKLTALDKKGVLQTAGKRGYWVAEADAASLSEAITMLRRR